MENSFAVSDKQVNVAAESPLGYIVGIVIVVVIIGVVVAVFFLRRRLARLSPSQTTNGNMNTIVKADTLLDTSKLHACQDKANERNERNNRDSTEFDQLRHRHQASTSSSLMQPTSVCEIDLEFVTASLPVRKVTVFGKTIMEDKDAIHEAESTTGVYYNNSVALKRSKVSVDGLVEYVDSLTQVDIKAAFETWNNRHGHRESCGIHRRQPQVHVDRYGNVPQVQDVVHQQKVNVKRSGSDHLAQDAKPQGDVQE
ncbi:hypothetical protein MAR_031436 [Mya arenaria]|uniref:Uncharacterized protein n=1 Tax=Mya arenaria TaxID=6604 RepID=A0ABY7F752_MYAAR|nr:hypothetical protein MAR_031436 [Mya arenaria]